jgi:toxin-antitoxin system PIN domain toxin
MTRRLPALLDVNVLIALFDETHVHHELAHDWFADEGAGGWATCPITENGFLRVMTHPRASDGTDRDTVFASLRKLCSRHDHLFWKDSVSLRDERIFDTSVIVSHRQLTDLYLLGLAVRNNGHLVTFDARIPIRAVKKATAKSLIVLGAA